MSSVTKRFWYDHKKKKVVQVRQKKSSTSSSPGIGAYSEANPLPSEGLGCMKSQVPEMRRVIRDHGIVGATVRDNGTVEFTSRGARRRLMKVRGLRDADGCYGDG